MSKPPKEWMLPLKTLGFAKKGPAFARTANDVDQTIFANKNLHDRTFQIWATVGIRDPYESKEYEQQYVFWSYIYPKALHFYSVQESWWPEKELPNSIDAII